MTRAQLFFLTCLALSVLLSALAVVQTKYESRRQFVALQQLREQRDQADIEWGRLQLELGTLGTHGRVEQLARSRLAMRQPRPHEVVVIRR